MTKHKSQNHSEQLEEMRHPDIANSMVNITNILGTSSNFNKEPKRTNKGHRIFKDEMRTFQEMGDKKKGKKVVIVAE